MIKEIKEMALRSMLFNFDDIMSDKVPTKPIVFSYRGAYYIAGAPVFKLKEVCTSYEKNGGRVTGTEFSHKYMPVTMALLPIKAHEVLWYLSGNLSFEYLYEKYGENSTVIEAYLRNYTIHTCPEDDLCENWGTLSVKAGIKPTPCNKQCLLKDDIEYRILYPEDAITNI